MRDIESLLKSVKKSTPKRQLSTSFTSDVLTKINAKEDTGSIFMKLFKKPLGAVLSVALVLASGATAFAAVANWPSIVSTLTGEQLLDSGARIVKIETEGCKSYEANDTSNKRISYYEIKKDSSLTNEKAVAMMRGICEEERAQNRVSKLVEQTGGSHSTRIFKIEHIEKGRLAVVADEKYELGGKNIRKTYTNIATDVRINNGSADLSFDQLKVGDSVILVVTDQRGISTEMQGYTEDLAQMQVRAILQVPALTGSPDLFYEHIGKDFVRVEPTKDGKGFERVYEFHKQ